MLDVDELVRPYYDVLVEQVGELDLYDAHTHIGNNDPDGFRQTPEQLLRVLDNARARAVVFPMHEPDGYRAANDIALAAAAGSGGRLVAFCRVNPHDDAVAEATRALDAGAAGIKLHPRAEQFTLHEPAVRELIALAHERERARADPRRPRDPGARPGHGQALGGVPRREASSSPTAASRTSPGCGRCCPTTRTCS